MADLPLEHRSRPPADDGDGPAPALVLCHGLGADETDLLGLADRFPDRAHVLSVRAPDRHGPGHSWFDFEGQDPADATPVAADLRRSRDRLDQFVDGAVDAYDLDPARVGVVGFSQGAVLGMGSLVEAPDRYALCVASHGFFPDAVDPAADVDRPALVTGGTADRVVPTARTEAAAARLRDLGCDVTAETYDAGHAIAPAELRDAAAWVADRL